MRATGGRPTQLTRGAGPDKGIRVSADGRTALYLNKRQLETIGWWDVVTGESGRVTREDEPLGMPVVPSGDGMRIALPIRDPDAVSMAQAVMVMNRDGSGRRTVITAEQDPRAFDWAPMIAASLGREAARVATPWISTSRTSVRAKTRVPGPSPHGEG